MHSSKNQPRLKPRPQAKHPRARKNHPKHTKPQLPPELLHLVFQHLAIPTDLLNQRYNTLDTWDADGYPSKSTILACSLVSHLWRGVALDYLFESVSFRFVSNDRVARFPDPDPVDGHEHEQCPGSLYITKTLVRFRRMLKASPDVASRIRCLSLAASSPDWNHMPVVKVDREAVEDVLSLLPRLEEFTAENFFMDSVSPPLEERAPKDRVRLRPNVRCLRIQHPLALYTCRFPGVDEVLAVIGMFGEIEHLYFGQFRLEEGEEEEIGHAVLALAHEEENEEAGEEAEDLHGHDTDDHTEGTEETIRDENSQDGYSDDNTNGSTRADNDEEDVDETTNVDPDEPSDDKEVDASQDEDQDGPELINDGNNTEDEHGGADADTDAEDEEALQDAHEIRVSYEPSHVRIRSMTSHAFSLRCVDKIIEVLTATAETPLESLTISLVDLENYEEWAGFDELIAKVGPGLRHLGCQDSMGESADNYGGVAFYTKVLNCCPNLRDLTFTGWVDDPGLREDDPDPREANELFWDKQVAAALDLCLNRAGLDTVTLEIGAPRPARSHLEQCTDLFHKLDTLLCKLADGSNEHVLQKVVVRHRQDYIDEYRFFRVDHRGMFDADDQQCLREIFPKLEAKGILRLEES